VLNSIFVVLTLVVLAVLGRVGFSVEVGLRVRAALFIARRALVGWTIFAILNRRERGSRVSSIAATAVSPTTETRTARAETTIAATGLR